MNIYFIVSKGLYRRPHSYPTCYYPTFDQIYDMSNEVINVINNCFSLDMDDK